MKKDNLWSSRESLSRVLEYMQVKKNCLKVLGGLGIAIISTNQRRKLQIKEARKLGVGGEVLAFVW